MSGTTLEFPTFRISEDGLSITCLRCGRTSYSRGDVEHRYCGHCHVFHNDFLLAEFVRAKLKEKTP